MERAERSLQAPPLQKCRKAAPPKKCRKVSTTKKCHKAAPPKKCRKEGRLKICSKCSPPQKCCEAALQKVPCYVKWPLQKMSKQAPPHLANAAKQPPLKNTTKQSPQNASTQPPLRFRSRPPLTLIPSLMKLRSLTNNSQTFSNQLLQFTHSFITWQAANSKYHHSRSRKNGNANNTWRYAAMEQSTNFISRAKIKTR